MDQDIAKLPTRRWGLSALIGALVVVGLYASSLSSFLLFHSLVELFSIVTAFVIFVIAWHTRGIQDNQYLLLIGIASLSAGAIELVHTLAYMGMGVFPGYSADVPTQLWIAFRYVFSVSILLASFFIKRGFKAQKVLTLYGIVTVAVLYTVFSGRFPACFVEGSGLTPFKIYSEYIIVLIFLAGLALLIQNRRSFDRTVFLLMAESIIFSVASELSFTHYVSVFGPANMIGHFFLLASMVLIYRALVITGIVEPSSLLFRDLKRREEAIRESEERYRTLVELSPDAITVHGGGVWQYVNPAGLALFGASSPEEIVGTPVLDRIHPGDRVMVEERIRLVESSAGFAGLREIRMFRMDGACLDVESTAARVWYRGRPAVQVIIRNVTERRKTERALEKIRAELAVMIEKVPIATLLVDRDRRVRKANVAAASFAGSSEAGMTGLRAGEAIHCMHSLDHSRGCGFGPSCPVCPVRTAVKDAFERGAHVQGREACLSVIRGGRRDDRTVVLTTMPVTIGDEQLTLVCVEDITERKKTELEVRSLNSELKKNVLLLEAANRELESFAYSVSHDLRAPLRSIDGFAYAILEEYADRLDNTGQGYLQRVRAAAAKMGQLIDALLNLSRLTCGEINRSAVDLSTLARSLADDLKNSDPRRNVRFDIADNMVAGGDPVMLHAALENLLRNAWKFTGKRDTACIEFGMSEHETRYAKSENGSGTVYFVRDNGAGFDMVHAKKLFTAFQRLHPMEDYPGIGIGLATVQRIIHRHGGEIWAEGEVGKGATFYFTL